MPKQGVVTEQEKKWRTDHKKKHVEKEKKKHKCTHTHSVYTNHPTESTESFLCGASISEVGFGMPLIALTTLQGESSAFRV